MTAKEIARGGLLAAAAVALLWIGSISPWMGLVMAVSAGVCTALPLIRGGRMRLAVLLFLAAAVLSWLLLPRKSLALGYSLLCGLYPLVKYAIEDRLPQQTQQTAKLIYWNAVCVVLFVLVKIGLLPFLSGIGTVRTVIGWLVANVIFLIYDRGLSGVIAVLRRTMPPL